MKENNKTTKIGSAFSGHNGFNIKEETFTHPKIKMEPEK